MGEYAYEDYRSMIHSKAALTYFSLIPQGDFGVEDLEQEGYFIFLNAARTYDRQKGKLQFAHYLWMKLHFGFKDYFRKLDYLPRGLSSRRAEPLYSHPARLESVLELENEWGLPRSLKHHDDIEKIDEHDVVERFWASFLEELPYHHRVAFNTWRHTGSQVRAAEAANISEGRMSQLMKKLDQAAIDYGKALRGHD